MKQISSFKNQCAVFSIIILLLLACSKNDDVKPAQLLLNTKYKYSRVQVGNADNKLERYVITNANAKTYKKIESTSFYSDLIKSTFESNFDLENIEYLTFTEDNQVKLELSENGVVTDTLIWSYSKENAPFSVKIFENGNPDYGYWFKLNPDQVLYKPGVVYFIQGPGEPPFFDFEGGPITPTTPGVQSYFDYYLNNNILTTGDTLIIGQLNAEYKP